MTARHDLRTKRRRARRQRAWEARRDERLARNVRVSYQPKRVGVYGIRDTFILRDVLT